MLHLAALNRGEAELLAVQFFVLQVRLKQNSNVWRSVVKTRSCFTGGSGFQFIIDTEDIAVTRSSANEIRDLTSNCVRHAFTNDFGEVLEESDVEITVRPGSWLIECMFSFDSILLALEAVSKDAEHLHRLFNPIAEVVADGSRLITATPIVSGFCAKTAHFASQYLAAKLQTASRPIDPAGVRNVHIHPGLLGRLEATVYQCARGDIEVTTAIDRLEAERILEDIALYTVDEIRWNVVRDYLRSAYKQWTAPTMIAKMDEYVRRMEKKPGVPASG
jgi:hypothetical protein